MTLIPALPDLPVKETFTALKKALSSTKTAILEAPPGAGKTTLVPLALLQEDWLKDQKIIMLEPRRLAARTAAKRMASLLSEKVGETVGYRIRQDKKVSAKTRIEVVTEGILTRQLQSDPELSGVGLVIFDEFHERNLQGDISLAFCLEAQEALREDLRLLVMSATLDGENLSTFLNNAPRITSQGRAFAVETRNLARPDKFTLSQDVARAVQTALQEESGNILVFLPGEGEIRKTQSILQDHFGKDSNLLIAPLYGSLPQQAQDQAILPTPKGQRKVVLATTIAETSLTIEGIRVVIDCGLKRVSRFDPANAMSKLETVRVSKASAEQRKGRAGRMEPGVCYQLWPKAETQSLAERDSPEILDCDLTPFAIEIATWGAKHPSDIRLLDLPPAATFEAAQHLLQQLGALDDSLSLTPHGRKISALSLHPRIAHMVLQAHNLGTAEAALACDIAAVLHDGPLFRGKKDSDLRHAVSCLQNQTKDPNLSKGALMRARETAKNLKYKLKIPLDKSANSMETGPILALAYPDRIAQQRQNGGTDYKLSSGMGAKLNEDDPLITQPYLVVAQLDGSRTNGRIFSAAPLTQKDIEDTFADQIIEMDDIGWDKRTQSAQANRLTKFGALTLKKKPIKITDPEQIKRALCQGITDIGLHVLPWTRESEQFCQRVEFLRQSDETWPDMSETALRESLETWLAPFLNGCSRIEQLKKIDLSAALLSRLDWAKQQDLNQRAPTHYKVPSGSNIRLDYSNIKKPILSVKLQEMFGQPQSPSINNGACPLQIHLLSPAGRPLQITEDLAGFWLTSYDSVKKEMKGRYPKHPWPDNPQEAMPTHKTKRHLR